MASQNNIISDLSTYTNIPIKAFTALTQKEILCIGSSVHDAIIKGESAVVLNIGLGTLSISLIDMTCKFIPSKELKSTIKKSLTSKIDVLEEELEQSIINKLVMLCEDCL